MIFQIILWIGFDFRAHVTDGVAIHKHWRKTA